MANKPIVIIHGWSDHSASFDKLARRLARETGQPTAQIWLADYISLDDEVRLDDLSAGLERAWGDRQLPTGANAIDVVVHSTGGLVIRAWMQHFYHARGQRPPVQNLVMLAPANFGSPLAHKGRSLIGRVFKGASSDRPFETGGQILRALEMASPISWTLAEEDRFAPNVFSGAGVRCTVLVGNTGYSGIRSLANEPGSDGTVYVATANLNCARLSIDVVRSPGDAMDEIRLTDEVESRGRTAFRVLDGLDHSEITGNERLTQALLDPILDGLRVKANGFGAWCDDCDAHTAALVEKYARKTDPEHHAFQNTVFRVSDDQGAMVDEYTVEFYGNFDDSRDRWARVFHNEILTKVHAYGDNAAYRSMMIDVTRLRREVGRQEDDLKFSFSALPDIREDRNRVGYKSIGMNDIGQLVLNHAAIHKYFQPNRTLLVDIRLPRYQRPEVFRLTPL